MNNRFDLIIFDWDGTVNQSHRLDSQVFAEIRGALQLPDSHPEPLLQQYQPMACLQQPTELLNFI